MPFVGIGCWCLDVSPAFLTTSPSTVRPPYDPLPQLAFKFLSILANSKIQTRCSNVFLEGFTTSTSKIHNVSTAPYDLTTKTPQGYPGRAFPLCFPRRIPPSGRRRVHHFVEHFVAHFARRLAASKRRAKTGPTRHSALATQARSPCQIPHPRNQRHPRLSPLGRAFQPSTPPPSTFAQPYGSPRQQDGYRTDHC
jgi:hypothetical protein